MDNIDKLPLQLLQAFVLLFLFFVPLERLFYLRNQKVFRAQWFTDALHFFANYFLVHLLFLGMAFGVIKLLQPLLSQDFQARIGSQSAWLQFVEAILIADLVFYFGHRLAHAWPWLWKVHSIHHAVQEMDWLASARLHPLDQALMKTLVMIPLFLMGFSKSTFGFYLVFTQVQAFFIHSNLRFRFGPLRWVIATPEFHHWHHGMTPRAYNSNFAGQFPFLDLIFGTLYMPRGSWPEKYGIPKPIPSNYLKQLAHPFRKRSKNNGD